MIMSIILAVLAAVGSVTRVTEHVDPITDERSIYAIIGDPRVHVAMGCSNANDPRTVRVVAHFNEYVGEARPGILAGGREVLYRFDQRAPRSVLWYAHDREVFAESTPTNPIQFMLEIKGSTGLNLRSIDAAGDQANMSLTYTDPTAVVEDVLVRCGFTTEGRKPKK
jgi:hypothetical protein